jgi:hypothetical protein
MMRRGAIIAAVTLFAVTCTPPPKPNPFGNFLKNRPEPTDSAITEKDLKTRMYVFADDSMMGRQAGREGNTKATAYIARELGRLGVTPAGDNGTYFQNMPWMARRYAATSTLTVGSRTLRWLTDWAAVPGATPAKGFDGVRAIYGGAAGDTSKQITAQQAQGKFVILTTGTPVAGGWDESGNGGRHGRREARSRRGAGAAVRAQRDRRHQGKRSEIRGRVRRDRRAQRSRRIQRRAG